MRRVSTSLAITFWSVALAAACARYLMVSHGVEDDAVEHENDEVEHEGDEHEDDDYNDDEHEMTTTGDSAKNLGAGAAMVEDSDENAAESGRKQVSVWTKILMMYYNVLQGSCDVLCFSVGGCVIGYLILVVVWAIFSAVLNPNTFLVYCASAIVLLVFALQQHGTLSKLYKAMLGMAESKIESSLRKRSTEIYSRIPTGGGNASEQAAAEQKKNAIIDAVRKEAAKAGFTARFSLDELLKVVSGDLSEGVLTKVAHAAGSQSHLTRMLVASERGKNDPDDAIRRLNAIAHDVTVLCGLEDPLVNEVVLLLVEISRAYAPGGDEAGVRSIIKRLFIALQKAQRNSGVAWPASSLHPETVASVIEFALVPDRYLESSGRAGPDGSPAFAALVAALHKDDLMLFNACHDMAVVALASKSSSGGDHAPIVGALQAFVRLKEGTRVMETCKKEAASYEQLGDLLRFTSSPSPRPGLPPRACSRSMAGMLLRFSAARMQGQKALMMTMAGELAQFLNHAALPLESDGEPSDGLDRHSMSGMLAIKFGAEVNIRAFARECGIDENVANGVAFLLCYADGDGAQLFTLLTQLDLISNVGFLAEDVSEGARDPRRLLALMTMARRKCGEESAMDVPIQKLARDFSLLHLDGDEPRVASLVDKTDAITYLLRILCASSKDSLNKSLTNLRQVGASRRGSKMATLLDESAQALLALGLGLGGSTDSPESLLSALNKLGHKACARWLTRAIKSDAKSTRKKIELHDEPSRRRTACLLASEVERSTEGDVNLTCALLRISVSPPNAFVTLALKSVLGARFAMSNSREKALQQLLSLTYIQDCGSSEKDTVSKQSCACLTAPHFSLVSPSCGSVAQIVLEVAALFNMKADVLAALLNIVAKSASRSPMKDGVEMSSASFQSTRKSSQAADEEQLSSGVMSEHQMENLFDMKVEGSVAVQEWLTKCRYPAETIERVNNFMTKWNVASKEAQFALRGLEKMSTVSKGNPGVHGDASWFCPAFHPE